MNRPDWKSRPLRLWILAAFLRALSWIGIRIDLLVIVREGETPIDVSQSPDDYDYDFILAADIEELYRLDPENYREKLGAREEGLRETTLSVVRQMVEEPYVSMAQLSTPEIDPNLGVPEVLRLIYLLNSDRDSILQ